MEAGIKTKQEWDIKWKDIFAHYQQDIRHAYYIRSVLDPTEERILEIGAGSFRDMNALNNWGISCFGTDYSEESVSLAKRYFPLLEDKISCMDAFSLSFGNKEFDLSFHNGFWGCFDDDDIQRLLKEQVRVTKHRIVATVHNKHNTQFVEYFKRLSENDPLYKIRFFEMEEITELMKAVCKEIKIIPVGKGKKFYEDDLINIGLGDAEFLKKSFDYHELNLLTTSERLMCIGKL